MQRPQPSGRVMRVSGARAAFTVVTLFAVTAGIAACGGDDSAVQNASTAHRAAPAPVPARPPASTPAARPKNWFDLQVGDCVAAVPQVDLGEVTASVVDCASAHQAEVYLRAPVEVDAAIADVADRRCAEGVFAYTGRPAHDGSFVVTYLIDSTQDRTSDNPLPSMVICLLQAGNGSPLTGSARR